MIEVILLAIIDSLRGNENEVRPIQNEKEMRRVETASIWRAIAKIGLPIAYMLVTLAIVVPRVINVVIKGSQ